MSDFAPLNPTREKESTWERIEYRRGLTDPEPESQEQCYICNKFFPHSQGHGDGICSQTCVDRAYEEERLQAIDDELEFERREWGAMYD